MASPSSRQAVLRAGTEIKEKRVLPALGKGEEKGEGEMIQFSRGGASG
jgi:hypothetical protein